MSALDTTEQRAKARTVLCSAAELYRSRRGSLLDCIKLAAVDLIDAEFARRVLRGVLWTQNLVEWEAHPMRRRDDIWRALRIAIRWCSRRPDHGKNHEPDGFADAAVLGGFLVGHRPTLPARAVTFELRDRAVLALLAPLHLVNGVVARDGARRPAPGQPRPGRLVGGAR